VQRLLVVEDDNSVRDTITTFLELEGYSVDAVSSTREALERLRSDAYPIVISDIYLDERTGLDVLETARQNNPKCAVILMTARGTMEAARCRAALPGKPLHHGSRSWHSNNGCELQLWSASA